MVDPEQQPVLEPIPVAVIGCGYWGPNLARNFNACRRTELAWLCDVNPGRLEAVAAGYPGVRSTTDLQQVLDDPRVRAVAVAVPVRGHYPVARAALERGRHVLLEKPLALGVAQGRELVGLAAASGLKLMCDHTFCYASAGRKIREGVERGDLGDLPAHRGAVRGDLGAGLIEARRFDIAQHDVHPGAGEAVGERATHAAGGTGDDGCFTCEILHEADRSSGGLATVSVRP